MNRIRSNKKGSLFCYHLTRSPANNWGKDSAVAAHLFNQIAIEAIVCFRDYLRDVGDDMRITEPPCSHLTTKQQEAACTALLLAMHQPGYEAENFILEQVLNHAVFTDFEVSCDTPGTTVAHEPYRSWSRLNAIWHESDLELVPVNHEDWPHLEDSLFWDEDWQLFPLRPEAICETKKDLEAYFEFSERGLIAPQNTDLWAPYSFTDEQLDEIGLTQERHSTAVSLGVLKKDSKIYTVHSQNRGGCIYCIREKDGHIKIGKTTGSPVSRLKSLQTANPKILEVCFAIKHPDHSRIEREIHQALGQYRVAGEWFDCGITEARRAFEMVTDAEWIDGGAA